jgi:hypothetical protein
MTRRTIAQGIVVRGSKSQTNTEDEAQVRGFTRHAIGVAARGDGGAPRATVVANGASRLPAEEPGLLWRDRIAHWRAKHAHAIATKAQELLGDNSTRLHAHPRLVIKVMEHGSWSDDDMLQDMWAGLLARNVKKWRGSGQAARRDSS